MYTPDKLLSIIIPTYNMEQYLRYCLDSLLIKENFEALDVLIINDGSKDSSSAIAHEYADRYPTVFRVIDKENGNYGSCINRGLKEATGKYIKVLDADDSFDTTHFEEFVAFLLGIDADLVLSDFAVVNKERLYQRTIHYDFPIKGVVPFAEFCDYPDFVGAIQMHAVTYRLELLTSINYRQTEGISYTDQQWIFTPMIGVKSVVYFNKAVYRYLIGREGQTMDPKIKLRSMAHSRKNSLGLILDYETHKNAITTPKIKSYLYSRLAWYIKDIYIFYITNYSKSNAKILHDYDKKIQEMSHDIYSMIGSKKVSSILGFPYIDYWRKHDISIILVSIIARTYRFVVNVKSKINSNNDRLSIGN